MLVLSAERKRACLFSVTYVCADIQSFRIMWPFDKSDRQSFLKPATALPSTRLDDAKAALSCMQAWLPEAKLDAADSDSKSSVHRAVAARDLAGLALLLMNGASPNTVDAYGTTPLYWAIRARDLDACKVLVHQKADISFGSQSAIECAEEQGAVEIAMFLARVPVAPLVQTQSADASAILSLLSAHAEFRHFLNTSAQRPPQCTDMLAHLFVFAALALQQHGAFENKQATVGSVIRAAHSVFGERYSSACGSHAEAKRSYVELLLKSGSGVKVCIGSSLFLPRSCCRSMTSASLLLLPLWRSSWRRLFYRQWQGRCDAKHARRASCNQKMSVGGCAAPTTLSWPRSSPRF